jgi:hypothetical protein
VSATRVIIDPKRVAGHIFPPFDFLAQMDVGDTLSGVTVTVTVWSGVDANPSAVWDASTIIAGSIVRPGLQAGLAGVIYLIKITAGAGSKVLVLEGLLAILPEGM